MDAHGEEEDNGELNIAHLVGTLLTEQDAINLEEAAYLIYKGLHDAIINDNINMVNDCAITGISLDQHFDESINEQHAGITPLALACALNKLRAVKILIENDADINLPFAALNTTALMTSCYHGHMEIVRILLQNGADVQAEDLQKSTALGYAFGGNRNVEVIKMLLQSKINVNHKNVLGMNALLLVSGYGDPALVDLVLQYGADPLSINDYGHTALHLAVDGKNNMVKRILAESGFTDHNAHRGQLDAAVLDWAKHHQELVGGPSMDEGALEQAGELLMAISQNLKEMKPPAEGEDTSTQDRKIQAIYMYRQKRLQLSRENKKSGIWGLLSCGGGKGGKSPKMAGQKPLEGAPQGDMPPQMKDDLSRHSLAFARILKRLVDSGCMKESVDHTFGMTALDLSIIHADIESTAVLTAAGADPHHFLKMIALREFYQSVKSKNLKDTREQLQFDEDLDVNHPYPDNLVQPESREGGMTPFALVCSQSDLETAKIMLKKGARVNEGGPSGRFPMTEAAANNDLKMAHTLITNGGSLEVASKAYSDATPVTVAAIHKNRDMVDFLIKKGAKVDKPMSDGRNALFASYENNDLEVMNMILAAPLEQNFTTSDGFVAETAKYYQSPDGNMEVIIGKVKEVYGGIMEENQRKEENARTPDKPKQPTQPPHSTTPAGGGPVPGSDKLKPTRTGALVVMEPERPRVERESPPPPSRPTPSRESPPPPSRPPPSRESPPPPSRPPPSRESPPPPPSRPAPSRESPPAPSRPAPAPPVPLPPAPSPPRENRHPDTSTPEREPQPPPMINDEIVDDGFVIIRERSTNPNAPLGRLTETTRETSQLGRVTETVTTETRVEGGVEHSIVRREKVVTTNTAAPSRWGARLANQPTSPTSPLGPPPPLPSSLPPPPPAGQPPVEEEEEEESESEEEESEEEESEEEEEEEEETVQAKPQPQGQAPKATVDDEDDDDEEEESEEEESEEEESEEEESEEEEEAEEEAPEKADVNRNQVNAHIRAAPKPVPPPTESSETEV